MLCYLFPDAEETSDAAKSTEQSTTHDTTEDSTPVEEKHDQKEACKTENESEEVQKEAGQSQSEAQQNESEAQQDESEAMEVGNEAEVVESEEVILENDGEEVEVTMEIELADVSAESIENVEEETTKQSPQKTADSDIKLEHIEITPKKSVVAVGNPEPQQGEEGSFGREIDSLVAEMGIEIMPEVTQQEVVEVGKDGTEVVRDVQKEGENKEAKKKEETESVKDEGEDKENSE